MKRKIAAILALSVLMIAALGTAARPGSPVQSPLNAPSNSRTEKTARSDGGDREISSDPKSRDADAWPRADAAAVTQRPEQRPSTPAVTVEHSSREAENCMRYLPSIGTSVEVACEAVEDVQAPEHACDRLAATPSDPNHVTQGVAFDSIQPTEAVTACREAVERYPQTRRFKFQLARALHRDAAYGEAIQLYRPLAEAGYVSAMNGLGLMYEHGNGVAKDETEAIRLYRQAAEKGAALAMINLGRMYAEGRGVAKDETEAVRLFRQAAEKGEVIGMYALGVMYASGRGAAKDETEAVGLYRQAAEKGNADAMNALGVMYESGLGVAKGETEAVRLYRQAAEKGNAAAMDNLGRMYESGRGVAKDEAEAVRLFRQAAEKGYALAMYNLGNMYAFGRGVAKDEIEAARWVFSAIENGDDFSIKEMTTNAAAWSAGFRAELQRRLRDAGTYSGPSDGDFGPATTRAIADVAARKKQP